MKCQLRFTLCVFLSPGIAVFGGGQAPMPQNLAFRQVTSGIENFLVSAKA
jgi:hypothetical protein